MKRTMMTLFLTMLLCTPIVHAQMGNETGQPGDGARMENRIQQMFEQLDLNDEQKKMIEANRAKNKDAKNTLREEMKANMKAMGEELKKADLDMPKINALHEASKQLFNKMADQRFNSILEVRKILTKEQFAKFTEMMEKRMGRHSSWRNGGMNTDKP